MKIREFCGGLLKSDKYVFYACFITIDEKRHSVKIDSENFEMFSDYEIGSFSIDSSAIEFFINIGFDCKYRIVFFDRNTEEYLGCLDKNFEISKESKNRLHYFNKIQAYLECERLRKCYRDKYYIHVGYVFE